MRRRDVLGAAGALALAGCGDPPEIAGGFVGTHPERGHALRDATARAPDTTRRTRVLIAGGGVAGLAAARALRLRAVDDFALLELEDAAGGNARAGLMDGLACPLGAHYLPLPGNDAHEVQDLLEELGLRQRVAGRWIYDERHLCHSPQDRLFFNGHWQEGLLPLEGVGPDTLAQYRRFGARVRELMAQARFAMPTLRAPITPLTQTLSAQTFAHWLDREGLNDPHLRWYLDYACRDDYGAGTALVSAWAGLHYFASRHGFHAPGEGDADAEPVLTWPEGNAWLTQRLAAPCGDRIHTGRTVLRIDMQKHGVAVDALDHATGRVERWLAERCVVALPVFVAARVVQNAPDFVRQAAQRLTYAPWLVANLHLRAPLRDRPGAPPSWDNVLYGSAGLGYVDASHQSLNPRRGPTVLTWYLPLGDDALAGRRALLDKPWTHWREQVLADLSVSHPDLRDVLLRVDITRYGHAMACPTPGPQVSWPMLEGRLHFAHSDWSGYSVFEEAFTRGHLAGAAIAGLRG
ncbi:MAG: FAD-dependent oxidoreductase [Hydrogenophaga sp.]|nr:FAD-dependent oxidoreductase [Hydrogenophaga sp.]